MGLLDIFKSGPPGRFVQDPKYRDNVNMQVDLAPKTLDQLRNIGLSEDRKLKLEYFFYTNTLEKAAQFANHLQNMNYGVNFGKSAGDRKLFIVTGWTTKMKTDNETVQAWAKQMCELGYTFDCEFDGWGTTPEQD